MIHDKSTIAQINAAIALDPTVEPLAREILTARANRGDGSSSAKRAERWLRTHPETETTVLAPVVTADDPVAALAAALLRAIVGETVLPTVPAVVAPAPVKAKAEPKPKVVKDPARKAIADAAFKSIVKAAPKGEGKKRAWNASREIWQAETDGDAQVVADFHLMLAEEAAK